MTGDIVGLTVRIGDDERPQKFVGRFAWMLAQLIELAQEASRPSSGRRPECRITCTASDVMACRLPPFRNRMLAPTAATTRGIVSIAL